MKKGISFHVRSLLGNAVWLGMVTLVVWSFRFYVAQARAEFTSGSKEELVAQARRHLGGDQGFATKLANAALNRTKDMVRYDGNYVKISYPNGDVPAGTGVCTDEVIRSYRALGFDLQKLVHEDMLANFSVYPKQWGLPKPDSNIDHRRVPNLQVFFKRQGASLPVTNRPEDYRPGDLVTCMLPGNRPHIMLVVPAPDGGPRPWVVQNIGEGPQLEDGLFEYPTTGHYRWHPAK